MQVPQFILDDMIEAGRGGHCNIICTQPRRIAVRTIVYYLLCIHTIKLLEYKKTKLFVC